MKPGTVVRDTSGIWLYIGSVLRFDPWQKRVGRSPGVVRQRQRRRWHRFLGLREVEPSLVLRTGRVLPPVYTGGGRRWAGTRLEDLVTL